MVDHPHRKTKPSQQRHEGHHDGASLPTEADVTRDHEHGAIIGNSAANQSDATQDAQARNVGVRRDDMGEKIPSDSRDEAYGEGPKDKYNPEPRR